ncbi:hypothetical protein ACS0TY_004230 [Phlomoides rotata]
MSAITWGQLIECFGDASMINAYEDQYLGMFLGGLQPSVRDRLPDSEMTYVFASIRAARCIARIYKLPSLQQNPFTHGSYVSSTASPNFGMHVEGNEPNSVAATQILSQPAFPQSAHLGSSASQPN